MIHAGIIGITSVFYLLNSIVVLLLCSQGGSGLGGTVEIDEEKWRQGKFNNGIPTISIIKTYLLSSTSWCQ